MRERVIEAVGRGGREMPGGALKVLVVDDLPAHQRLARCVFEALGCQVWTADDGLAALDMAKCMAFDLILMDRNMPRCDGDQATQLIRASPGASRDARIISHSSCPPTGKARRMYDAIIAKPARIADVVEHVFPNLRSFRRRRA